MSNIKRIVCVQSITKYKKLLVLFKEKYPDIQVISSLDVLQDEMKSNSNINIAFIEDIYINELNKELRYQFNFDNNICIVISDGIPLDFKWKPYIYDILEYNNLSNVNHLLNRLAKDISYREQYFSTITEIREFYKIGQKLASEKDVNTLMELIIDSCMKMTSADAGSVYIIVDNEEGKNEECSFYEKNSENKYLKFAIAKNNSIELNLQSSIIPIVRENIVGYSVINGKPVRIDDAYNISSRYEYKFSSKFDEQTGYKTKSILTVPMKDHNNRILGVIQLLNKMEKGEAIPFNFKDEVTVYSFAGQASIALENNSLYKSMEGLLEKYRATINDEIVKRKQTDEEVNKLLSAVEHSASSVIITDINGNIQYVNPKFSEISGYAYKEVIGKNSRILKSGYHNKVFYSQFWNTILSGEEWRGEFKNKKKNGETYWASASISSLKDDNDKVKYFIAVKEDITEKKLITAQLENKNLELEKAVDELKRTQAQLIHKERMAGIGQLAAGVAHEINNPLAFILSNTRTLKKYMSLFKELLSMYKEFIRANVDFKTKTQLDQIRNIKQYEEDNNLDFLVDDLVQLFNETNTGLEKVKDIVDALRRFSPIEQINEYEEYDLNLGIKNSLIVLKHEIDNITINEELGDISHLMAMGGEMNQAILHILSNSIYAIKEKEHDGGQIHIRTWKEGENIFCEIADNGAGIEDNKLQYIFNPFYTTRPEGEGMGLGLTIAYDIIVKKHNGEISVNSNKGEGTKITIRVPLKNR